MKPIKCWNCAYLGKCIDCNENGCEKFLKWKLTYREVADLCKVNIRTLFRWFNKNPTKALRTIYHLTGYKFQVYYDDCRSCLVRVIDKEKGNEKI